MILYKKNNLIFFFVIFLLLGHSNTQHYINKSDELRKEELDKDRKKNNNTREDYKEKESCLIEENNNLKIEVKIYDIYLNFLIILNVILFVALLSTIIYKIYFMVKEAHKSQDIHNEDFLESDLNNNNINDSYEKEKEYINNNSSLVCDDISNDGGSEAPPAQNI